MAAGATVWLDDLPAIVASLQRDWAITAGQTLSGGTDSYVAEVEAADGSPAVLKVIFPRDVPSGDRGAGAAGWPSAPAGTRPRSGSGASSSECPRAFCAPSLACSATAA
jgi:hypothetical protein